MNKKTFFTWIGAAFSGAFIALLLNHYFLEKEPLVIYENQAVNARNVSMNGPKRTYPFNLTKAAEAGTKVVVHIKAEESERKARERYRNRRRNTIEDFFNGGLFGFGYDHQFYRLRGGGSGVIISSDGYIVTNNHVVDFADDILVTLPDGSEYKARKIGTDPATDLAVLKIDETGLPTLKLADSDKAKLGEWVLAIGNPFDYLISSVTAGIISAKGRDINIIKGDHALEEFIQTDAAVNPGNSGGALVDAEGRLLGITSAIATPTGVYAGYSFAIPSNLMKKVVDAIIEKGGDLDQKVSLGVAAATITKKIQKDLNLSLDKGVYVDEVYTGSAAEFAGILPGDIIVKAGDKDINKVEDLLEVLKFVKYGEKLKFKIFRDNKYINISVTFKQSL